MEYFLFISNKHLTLKLCILHTHTDTCSVFAVAKGQMQIIGELKPKEKADQLIWLMPLILPVVAHIHSVSFLSRICTCAHTAAPAQKTK